MAGFSYRKNLDGSSQSPTLLYFNPKASQTIQVGDLVRVNTSGTLSLVATGTEIAGVVQHVVTSAGKAVAPDSGTNDTWTIAASGTTTTYLVGIIPALPNYLFYNDADDTLAATNNFQYFNTNDENDVDVATATDTATAQVRLIERDPDGDGDASKGLFQIVESQLGQVSVGNQA